MAPVPITEDYYMILEVEQTATLELINRSYKRLALKLHPDRNGKHDATEAFQLLARAYETLKDESKRRTYDLIYPTIRRSRPSSHTAHTTGSPPASTSQSEANSEAAKIAALQKSKQERAARWGTKKSAFDSSIFELQRVIRRLKQEIEGLDSIAAAEAAEDAQKNSWGTWLLSPIYKTVEESEEEKALKDRGRQERRIEKDMKDRRLLFKKAELKEEESRLRKAKEEVDAADSVDDNKIRAFQGIIWARMNWERQERERKVRQEWERKERERQKRMEEMIKKQQQQQREQREREAAEALKKQREAAEVLRKQREESRAAEKKRQKEQIENWQKYMDQTTKNSQKTDTYHNPHEYSFTSEASTHHYPPSACSHDHWWPKVQGRASCPECYESWTYLLQCPGCDMMACPRCQATKRPRRSRNYANSRTSGRGPPRPRTPDLHWEWDYD